MTIKDFFYFLRFSRSQQTTIFVFFILIIGLQLFFYYTDFSTNFIDSTEKQKWLKLQSQVDSLKNKKLNYIEKIYLFNPNYITDYKGYKLGMTVKEIDRLIVFRKQNKYVNSAKEFQVVTQVSDSLLAAIAPYFKFPDWVNNKNGYYSNVSKKNYAKKEKITVKDINQATQEDLIKISGIGEVLSTRILKFKESIGEFVSMEQMNDIWGLSPEVIKSLNASFKVIKQPKTKKIDINNASINDLSKFPYFNYQLARQIVIYRSMNGDFKNIDDLAKIKGMPNYSAKIIVLYLTF